MQLEQAMLEIVSNALDAMPGGGRLRIGGSVVANGGSGPTRSSSRSPTPAPGFPTRCCPRSASPFFTTRQEGTGLGLAIAKRYVEQNGGRLEITSRPGQGTTVRVRLPPARRGGARHERLTVLIVDDERTLARAIKAFLAESGYEAEVAGDAEQALELLETPAPRRGLHRRAAARA